MTMNSVADTVLTFQNIQLNYGKTKVLKDIDLKLKKGQITALVGPSGSGKTSLLMLAAGLEAPTSGQVIFNNQRLDNQSEDAIAKIRRCSIGVLFQAFHLHPALTAEENAAMPLLFERRPDALAIARESLKVFGLGHRLDHLPAKLSGGEQQRVALVRAFVNNPQLLLADEPTGNLDVKTGDHVMAHFFSKIRSTGAGALIVTHDTELAQQCDRILNLNSGTLHEPMA